MENQTPRNEPQRTFKGFYKGVKISVKTLDKFIIGGILAMLLLIGYGVMNNGYTVTYDSKGGTDVVSQECMYGDLLIEPEDPTREGYRFTGWYLDGNCIYPWDFDDSIVESSMTLYAGWEKVE